MRAQVQFGHSTLSALNMKLLFIMRFFSSSSVSGCRGVPDAGWPLLHHKTVPGHLQVPGHADNVAALPILCGMTSSVLFPSPVLPTFPP